MGINKRDNFFLQVTEEPTRRGAMLHFVLTNKEELVGNVKPNNSHVAVTMKWWSSIFLGR